MQMLSSEPTLVQERAHLGDVMPICPETTQSLDLGLHEIAQRIYMRDRFQHVRVG
jgi:hypothetical protein